MITADRPSVSPACDTSPAHPQRFTSGGSFASCDPSRWAMQVTSTRVPARSSDAASANEFRDSQVMLLHERAAVDTVVLAGVATHNCVAQTAADAYARLRGLGVVALFAGWLGSTA